MWKAPHVVLPGSKKLTEKKPKKQVSKRSKPKAPKPWDDSVNDLGTYKLSPEELEQRLAKRVSKNRVTVPQSEVQKIRQEFSTKHKGPDTQQSRFDGKHAKEVPPGWCLDFAAIAEGLKGPKSEDQSSHSAPSHQSENRDPNSSKHDDESLGNTQEGGVLAIAARSSSKQEDPKPESSSNFSEMASTQKDPEKQLHSSALADVGNVVAKAAPRESEVHLGPIQRSPGSIHVTPVVLGRNAGGSEKSCETCQGPNRDSATIRQNMHESSSHELDCLKEEVQGLRQQMNDLKVEVKDFMSHYSSMMTTVQSQIQQLLGFRDMHPASAVPRTGFRASLPPTGPFELVSKQSTMQAPRVGQGESHVVGGPINASTARQENLQKLTPVQSGVQPRGDTFQQIPSYNGASCRGDDALPSYAQMRRSELEFTVSKSLKDILQPSQVPQKVNSFPGSVVIPTTVSATIGNASKGDIGKGVYDGNALSQPSAVAKLRQNVPGSWVRPNSVLPQHPVYPTGPRTFRRDLDSTVSLGAYASTEKSSIGAMHKENVGRLAFQ